MNKENIQKIVEREIPIVKSMGVKFETFQESTCTIAVPLEPNHNHKGTAFGGSLYSVCTSACYGLMFSVQLEKKLNEFDLVIGEGTIRYHRPVDGDFFVKAAFEESDLNTFLEKLHKNGFAKIHLKAHVFIKDEGQHLCDYSATFIMLKKRD